MEPMNKDIRFPKAPILTFEWTGIPPKLNYAGVQKRKWTPFYHRGANFGGVYIFPFKICWRLPWLPHAAWQKGWDAHFRMVNRMGEYSENA